MYLSRFTKVHKKKENKAFGFCMIQISQSYCFYLTIYVFTEVCRIQKKKKKKKKKKRKEKERKRSYETYSFVRKYDRSNRRCKGDNYHFLVILKIFVRLGFYFELSVRD